MIKKIKVVIICHFSNAHIQSKLPLRKRVREFAPWIWVTLSYLKKYDFLEIHVISPHAYLAKDTIFIEDGIHYYFINTGIPLTSYNWPGFFRLDYLSNFYFNRKKVSKLVKMIKPDLVHMYGAENAYYSSSILDLANYPHLITIQGFLFLQNNPDSFVVNKRLAFEKKIIKSAKNFGIRYKYMEQEIRKLNPDASFYWHKVPVNVFRSRNNPKLYDLIFFARIKKEKGIEDFIKVVAKLVKQRNIPVKAVVTGYGDPKYMNQLFELSESLGCDSHIEFKGFVSDQKELHQLVQQSKICLLPTYNDTVPGTVIESMFLNVAVVSYDTGGLSTLNNKRESILLAEQGNISGLADLTGALLSDEKRRINLEENARKTVEEIYGSDAAVKELVTAYSSIVEQVKI